VVVHGDRPALARAFGALCALQPVRWDPAGLVCAPRADPEAAAPALARCPLPWRPAAMPAVWPAPPAAFVSGFYRRSPAHAPAPAGVPELVQADGEGFGPGGHVTTEMCLAALPGLPAGPAVDAGCGSGLLAQAWARLGRGPVLGLDLDGRALAQARAGVAAAGLTGRVALRRGPLEGLDPGELEGRTVLANLPRAAHIALLGRYRTPPQAALLSGLRRGEGAAVAAAYRRLGLVPVRVQRRRAWECWSLVRR
jgi:ribosomal protein L11 methyltransferase